MLVKVLNTKGASTGRTVDLPNEVFQIEPNNHVLYLYVKQYLAAQRQGTSQTKTRSQVQGSSKKLHRQKGTGGSRKGNIRNPLYKGGGRIFGPQARDYSFKLNKKEKTLARASALSLKTKENALFIVEDLQFSNPKTAQFVEVLKALKAADSKVLFLVGQPDENLFLSLRNLPKVKSVLLQDFNAYDVLNANALIFTESAAKEFIVDTVGKESSPKNDVEKKATTSKKTTATKKETKDSKSMGNEKTSAPKSTEKEKTPSSAS